MCLQENVPLEDIVCQLLDAVQPRAWDGVVRTDGFTLHDLRRNGIWTHNGRCRTDSCDADKISQHMTVVCLLLTLASGGCLVLRSKLCPVLVNTLCNLDKFLTSEAQDVHALRQAHATPHLTDFDRWVAVEYGRYSEEREEFSTSIKDG